MLYIPSKRAMFVHVPKTGGDAIVKFMRDDVPGTDMVGGGKHWPAWKYNVMVDYQFAFVREPVSWFRSYYAFITQNYIKPFGSYPIFEAGTWHPMRCFEKYDYKTFGAFVESVYADQPSYYTRLVEWMTGPPDAHMMNFIGKQENLADGLSQVLRNLGFNHAANQCVHMKKVNTSKSKFKIDPFLVDLIQEQESVMYSRFNYKKL